MSQYGLEGQVAIVTGASSGNGRGMALELAKYGMDVQCLARREENLKALVSEIEANGGKADYYCVDITDTEAVKSIFTQIIEKKGQIDLMVNNAGQNKAIGNTWETEPEEMWQEMTVNMKGTMTCTKFAVEQMVKQDSGRVINIAGGGTVTPHVWASAYSASKVAVVRFSETCALELEACGSNVKVFSGRPGLVLNDRTRALAESEECKKYWPNITDIVENHSDTMSKPEMVGDFIAYIASGAADAYTGRDLFIKMDREFLANNAEQICETNQMKLTVIPLKGKH